MKVFFDKNGLTRTSAQYYSNLASEQIKSHEAWLNDICFVNETKALLSSDNRYTTRVSNVNKLDAIDYVLKHISELYLFIGYIAEAQKAKSKAVCDIISFEEFTKDIIAPARPKHVTEEDIIDEFDSSKYLKYLRLQQFAATYGKAIHGNGSIAAARKSLYRVLNNPTVVENLTNDVIVTEYTPKFSIDEVDEMFNGLQATRREYDKQFNSMRFEILDEVNRRNEALDKEFAKQYEIYRNKIEQKRIEYNIFYRNKKEEIETTWKIVIPKELEQTFKWLQSLGKKVN